MASQVAANDTYQWVWGNSINSFGIAGSVEKLLSSTISNARPSSLIHSAVFVLLYCTILTLVYFAILIPAYNVFLHPLRRIPGPKLWAASQIPWVHQFLSGDLHKKSLYLHNKYGPMVRTGPNEVSFIEPGAWDAVMGHRKKGEAENVKASFYAEQPKGSIHGASGEDHARIRRLSSHGFSATSILEQQPLIAGYVELLIQRLRENCDGGRKPLDVSMWYSFTSFDIICDLTFGESLGCLRESAMHPWVALTSANLRTSATLIGLARLPLAKRIMPYLVKAETVKLAAEHKALTRELVSNRLALEGHRPDFLDRIIHDEGDQSMSRAELDVHAEFLTIAGSESTAIVLSNGCYFAARNPEIMKKVVEEVLSTFTKEEDINYDTAVKLRYLNAILKETFRFAPTTPNALPRITPPQGAVILDTPLPGNTVLAVPQWAMYRSKQHFHRADEFIPERWFGEGEFVNDRIDCIKPFSHGPRNCIGRNLAKIELHILFARLIWNFEFELAEESRQWHDRQAFITWERQPLYMYVRPRERVV